MVELLALDGAAPTMEDVFLKKLMKDSFKAKNCFSNNVSLCIPSSCSSLNGSNGVSPNSPITHSTSLVVTRISSTLAYVLTIQSFFNFGHK
jgi:hypothetical protein